MDCSWFDANNYMRPVIEQKALDIAEESRARTPQKSVWYTNAHACSLPIAKTRWHLIPEYWILRLITIILLRTFEQLRWGS